MKYSSIDIYRLPLVARNSTKQLFEQAERDESDSNVTPDSPIPLSLKQIHEGFLVDGLQVGITLTLDISGELDVDLFCKVPSTRLDFPDFCCLGTSYGSSASAITGGELPEC